MTARTGAEHLRAAIASNRPHRIANAVRSMAHAPSLDAVQSLADTICDAIASDGYSTRSAETVAQVTDARAIIASVMVELRENAPQTSPDALLLRQSVNGYIQLAAMNDPALGQRLEAVGTFSERLAHAMKVPAATVFDTFVAGSLHDIGLMEIPRPVRNKAVGLTKRDDERFKRHAQAGESFLLGIPALARLAPLVRAHHERFDGLGYPDGLRGDEIPVPSRIIAVAAAFVDLVTATPRFEAMLPHDACRELIGAAGAQFDPDVVYATLQLLHYRRRTNRSA